MNSVSSIALVLAAAAVPWLAFTAQAQVFPRRSFRPGRCTGVYGRIIKAAGIQPE